MLRNRNLNASEKTDPTSSASDKRGELSRVSNGDLLDTILSFDVRLTERLAVCANSGSACGHLRPLMKLLELSCHGIPWLLGTVVALLMSHQIQMHGKLLNLFCVLILDLVVVVLVKAVVQRKRPDHNNMDMFATVSVDKFSFPSGHTTRAASVVCFFLAFFVTSPLWRFLIITWAVSVSISRIMLGRHHVLDVVGGVIIGVLQYIMFLQYLWISSETCEDIVRPLQEELHL